MQSFLIVSLFAACSGPAQGDALSHASSSQVAPQIAKAHEVPASEEITAWLKSRAHDLSVGASSAEETRFKPALELVGKARVAAFEERIPGSHELAKMRGELLAFLVSQDQFNVLLLDASAPVCVAIDQWVLGGAGDVNALLARLDSKRFESGEVRSALEWMRKANQDPARTKKLRVAGLDAVDTRTSVLALQEFMAKIDPDQAERMSAMFGSLRQVDGQGRIRYLTASTEVRRAIGVLLEEQLSILLDQRDNYIEQTSVEAWETALEQVTLLSEAVDVLRGESANGANERRARSKLEELERQCSRFGPDARAIVWTTGEPLELEGLRATIAEHIKQKLRDECRVVSFFFDEGSVRRMNDKAPNESDKQADTITLSAAPAPSFEHSLADTGLSLALFDLRSPPQGAAADWMSSTVHVREALRTNEDLREKLDDVVPVRALDAALFVKRVTPAE